MRDFSSGELDGLLGIDFAVWNWSKPQLYGICLGMFVRNGLIPSSTALARLLDFIVDMAAGYFDNAYHSFLHAVDVTYMVYWSLVDLELAEKLQFSTVDFVAILIAALAHDVLHPGFNNLYQINAKTDVASKYDNKSVLEMQSCDHLSALLAKHSCLSGLEYGEVASHLVDIPKIIENIAIEAILHTDMCHHFELLEKLSFTAEEVIGPTDDSVESTSEEKLGQSESDEVPGELRMTQSPSFAKSESREGLMSAESLNAADAKPDDSVLEPPSSDDSNQGEGLAMVGVITPQHRQIMTNAILHAADISNAARPLEICKRWADMVAEEFFLQGEQERRTGLPVTPSMDRDSISPAQIGFDFNTYIARPYFEVLAEIFPTTRCLAENLISNRNTWENM
ncbi:uncharacterized protein EV422DRAFT_487941, partial [Fimicolochytrium jonesii]|uniref:uncharacterized protein n=1 Tax=Fimicolochytrium jonesii TaxID=1396493 RepID=UPI0022FF289F